MLKKIAAIFLLINTTLLIGCASAHKQHHAKKHYSHRAYKLSNNGICQRVRPTSKHYVQHGAASWYGGKFNNRRTASGERYNMYKMTAAHKSLPLCSYVMVTNLRNGRKVKVKITDRGPYVRGRIIDLSYAAAKKLGMVGRGTARVRINAVA